MTIFRRDGVAEAKIDDIVAIAGVSRGSFYFHFPTKDDVLAMLIQESTEKIAQDLEKRPPGIPLKELLHAVASAIAGAWEEDHRIFPEVATVAMRLIALTPLAENQRSLRAQIASAFRAAAARGELTKMVAPEILADVFLINLFTAAIAWAARPRIPLTNALKGMATLFMYGAHRSES
jgi:AcrR family transcriptional regulator